MGPPIRPLHTLVTVVTLNTLDFRHEAGYNMYNKQRVRLVGLKNHPSPFRDKMKPIAAIRCEFKASSTV
jgi:hypothetical protein